MGRAKAELAYTKRQRDLLKRRGQPASVYLTTKKRSEEIRRSFKSLGN